MEQRSINHLGWIANPEQIDLALKVIYYSVKTTSISTRKILNK